MKQESDTLYRLGGDNHLVIYYSEETDLPSAMMTIARRKAILEAKIPGVSEVTNGECSLMIHFDPMRIDYEDLLKEVKDVEKNWTTPDDWVFDSKLFELPFWFDDPWSMECYLSNKERRTAKEQNLGEDEILSDCAWCAQYIGLSEEEFISRVCHPQYLVFSVGFAAGLHGLLPLVEKDDFLVLPKYESPRPWTPARVLCGGGVEYAIHPYILPGGYSMLASTPVPTTSLDPGGKILSHLQERLTLATLGDRVRLRSIGKEEYEEIRARVTDGTYEYKVISQKWEAKKWIDDPRGYEGTAIA